VPANRSDRRHPVVCPAGDRSAMDAQQLTKLRGRQDRVVVRLRFDGPEPTPPRTDNVRRPAARPALLRAQPLKLLGRARRARPVPPPSAELPAAPLTSDVPLSHGRIHPVSGDVAQRSLSRLRRSERRGTVAECYRWGSPRHRIRPARGHGQHLQGGTDMAQSKRNTNAVEVV
jgi:hypothetical protein